MMKLCTAILNILIIITLCCVVFSYSAKYIKNNRNLLQIASYVTSPVLYISSILIVKRSWHNDNIFILNSTIVGIMLCSVFFVLGVIFLLKPKILCDIFNININVTFYVVSIILFFIFSLNKNISIFEGSALFGIYICYFVIMIRQQKNNLVDITSNIFNFKNLLYSIIIFAIIMIYAMSFDAIFNYIFTFPKKLEINEYDIVISIVSIISCIPTIIMSIYFCKNKLYEFVILTIINVCIFEMCILLPLSLFRFGSIAIQKDIAILIMPILLFTSINFQIKVHLHQSYSRLQCISMILTPILYYIYILF